MALQITFPVDLDNKGETYLASALQDLGAVGVSAREWRYERGAVSPDDFRTRLRKQLGLNANLADGLEIAIQRTTGDLLRGILIVGIFLFLLLLVIRALGE